jgi:outer membrane protein, adhesin transport system
MGMVCMTLQMFKATLCCLLVLPLSAVEKAPTKEASKEYTLQALIREALYYYPSVQAAKKRRQASFNDIDIKTGNYYPTIDFDGKYGRERSESPTISNTGSNYRDMTRNESSLRLRQLLFDGGTTTAQVAQSEARAMEQSASFIDTKEQIIFQVSRSYLDIQELLLLIKNAEENLKAHDRIERLVLKRVEKKVDDKSSAYLVQGRKSVSQANSKRYKKLLEAAYFKLKRFTGVTPTTLAAVPTELFVLKKPSEYTRQLKDHPVLKISASKSIAAQAYVDEKKRNFNPKVYLEVIGRQDDNLDGLDGEQSELGAYITVSFNIFRGGADKASYLQALNYHTATNEEQRETEIRLHTAVKVAFANYEAAIADVEYFKKHYENIEKTLKAYNSQYLIGVRSLFDLLNIQAELFRANETLIQAQSNSQKTAFEVIFEAGLMSQTFATQELNQKQP